MMLCVCVCVLNYYDVVCVCVRVCVCVCVYKSCDVLFFELCVLSFERRKVYKYFLNQIN